MKFLVFALLFSLLLVPTGKVLAEENNAQSSPVTLHGRLFLANEEGLGGEIVILATSEGIYYKLEGKLSDELKQKAVELGAKEIWLTGKKSGPSMVKTSIKHVYDEAGKYKRSYKETLAYIFFDVDSIDKIGEEIAIKGPTPKIGPVTYKEYMESLGTRAGLPPMTTRQIQGKIISTSLKTKNPIKTFVVRTQGPDKKEDLTIIVSSNTKIVLVMGEGTEDSAVYPTDLGSIRAGDKVDMWAAKKDKLFEALVISIIKKR